LFAEDQRQPQKEQVKTGRLGERHVNKGIFFWAHHLKSTEENPVEKIE
jgi:hypothetical protein